jgi:hypothetical protein
MIVQWWEADDKRLYLTARPISAVKLTRARRMNGNIGKFFRLM